MLSQISCHCRKFISWMLHAEPEICPVKSGGDHCGIPQVQQGNDIFLHFRCRRRCKGAQNRACAKIVEKFCNFQITRSEILPPLRYAVCLIHTHHRNLCLSCKSQKTLCQKPFRCHIDNLIPPFFRITKCSQILSLRQGTIQKSCVNTCLIQCGDLIFHQRNEW